MPDSTAHAGLTMNGVKSNWRWTVTSNADLEREATGTDRDASFTQTTGPWYFGSTFTAVCARLVVAPPISSGISKP